MGSRRRARELAIKVLFHMEFTPGDLDEVFHLICENFGSSKSIRSFSRQLVLGVCENKEELDRLISRSSKHWRLERMETVDRNLLRMSTEELLYQPETPSTVVINEAIEIARRFSTKDSPQFINGILDSIHKEIEKASYR